MLDLSIVIVSYNVRAYLLACLRSIYEQLAGIGVEVIVVDNVSTGGSAEAVRVAFPQVELIVAQENSGFGRGNNLGAQQAPAMPAVCLHAAPPQSARQPSHGL